MINYIRGVFVIYKKDMRLEIRTRETISTVFIFCLLVAFIFNFAFDPSPRTILLVGPGMIWVAYTFAGILGLNRLFLLEREHATLDGLMLTPIGREVIYGGKVLGNFTLLVVVEILMLPVFLLFYDLQVLSLWFAITLLASTLAFASIGTLFAAIAANTRFREIMLPLLFLPMILPVLIASVATTSSLLQGGGWSTIGHWLQLLIIFDIVFLVISSLTFEFVLGE